MIVGRLLPAEGDEGSKVTTLQLRQRREREEERRAEADKLGAGGEEQPLFLLTNLFMESADGVGD